MTLTTRSKDYQATIDYLYRHLPMFEKIGPTAFKKDLTNIRKLCAALGNPQNQFKTIHIAGTNGKGSVSHMLSSILIEAGYTTGLYISPHYKDYRERIRVQGTFISKTFITDFVAKIKPLIEEIRPSFFEITVAMAFEYFASKRVDVAVIETGLGGRLDSTNLITPILSIITNISLDHQNMLGNTLAEIAGEKAGIMKKDVPCLIGEYQRDPAKVFKLHAAALNIPIRWADRISTTTRNASGDRFTVDFKNDSSRSWSVASGRMGPYQQKNINTVVQAAVWLSQLGIPLLKRQILSGIGLLDRHAPLTGRWQIKSLEPMLLLDAAHNIAGIHYLFKEIASLKYKTLHIVFGTVRDKEVSPILKLMPKKAHYYFVQADMPRALDHRLLTEKARAFGLLGEACGSVKQGLKKAKAKTGKQDLVVVTGSIFVVGEVL